MSRSNNSHKPSAYDESGAAARAQRERKHRTACAVLGFLFAVRAANGSTEEVRKKQGRSKEEARKRRINLRVKRGW
ncbi:hypothetical protein NDS46_22135 [Paenibacillus thiaminolyticus]|uniref:hypothetical protein n=1 Tax=Paenibacillus thiaminolyticus TaxID=49283 RepID=UPI00232FEDE9|nr:hypothetical protein [Paenibacillus thiaminolyticus]WCF07015.1 hypothetical protein NDS46_22135 [Paenibacillus thiaminolyticus]